MDRRGINMKINFWKDIDWENLPVEELAKEIIDHKGVGDSWNDLLRLTVAKGGVIRIRELLDKTGLSWGMFKRRNIGLDRNFKECPKCNVKLVVSKEEVRGKKRNMWKCPECETVYRKKWTWDEIQKTREYYIKMREAGRKGSQYIRTRFYALSKAYKNDRQKLGEYVIGRNHLELFPDTRKLTLAELNLLLKHIEEGTPIQTYKTSNYWDSRIRLKAVESK
jgi:hypothetical protein